MLISYHQFRYSRRILGDGEQATARIEHNVLTRGLKQAVALGPLAGALLTHTWRYIFFINLPVAGITTAMTVFFMTLKTPRIGLREGLARMDCLGKCEAGTFPVGVACADPSYSTYRRIDGLRHCRYRFWR